MIKFPTRLESMIFSQTNFLLVKKKKNTSNDGGKMKFYFQVLMKSMLPPHFNEPINAQK